MCGRTCLTLDPNQIICACKYKSEKSSKLSGEAKPADTNVISEEKPEWRSELNFGRQYAPSYNIAPTDLTPVIVSSQHFIDDSKTNQKNGRVVVPMMWGMIPFWHKGDYRKHGLTTNNCRLEHMLESKLYRGPFRRGQRCVVVCEGFYEWQTTKSAKPSERAAYLLYMPQEKNVQIYDRTTWEPENMNLLKMAGLFDVWEDENGEKIYSYSIITFDSSKIMSWLHHRMPAILETAQQVSDWLEFNRVSDEEALATLQPAKELQWHRVTNLVNNSRNKSDQCNKPIELVQPQKRKPTSKIMEAWLNQRKRREDLAKISDLSDEDEAVGSNREDIENPAKRPRFRDLKSKKT